MHQNLAVCVQTAQVQTPNTRPRHNASVTFQLAKITRGLKISCFRFAWTRLPWSVCGKRGISEKVLEINSRCAQRRRSGKCCCAPDSTRRLRVPDAVRLVFLVRSRLNRRSALRRRRTRWIKAVLKWESDCVYGKTPVWVCCWNEAARCVAWHLHRNRRLTFLLMQRCALSVKKGKLLFEI